MAASTPVVTKGTTFTVAVDATVSNALDLQLVNPGQKVLGFAIKGTCTSTTMTFNASADGVNFYPLMGNTGSAVSITVASNTIIGFTADIGAELSGWRWLQAVMGSSELSGATILVVVD